MQLIVTEIDHRGLPYRVQSENGRYTWFVGAESYLHDTVAQRDIYQMAYFARKGFGSEALPDEVEADVHAFWAALREIEAAAQAADQAREIAEIAALPRESEAEFADRMRKAREFDQRHNEGGEGYNPYR